MKRRGSDRDDRTEPSRGTELDEVLLRPEIDRVFDSLADSDRRLVLLLLKEGAIETETDVLKYRDDVSKVDELNLLHTHLPKLDECGYIEWDRDAGELSEGPRFDEVAPLFELFEEHSERLSDRFRTEK